MPFHRNRSTIFPALVATTPAKLHIVESLVSIAPILGSITSARTQETTQFEINEWIEDFLSMFGLSRLDCARLGRIEDNDG
jgi:hypothetical protein